MTTLRTALLGLLIAALALALQAGGARAQGTIEIFFEADTPLFELRGRTDSSTLPAEDLAMIKLAARQVKAGGFVRIGMCWQCPSGSFADAARRRIRVRNALISEGVPADEIVIISFGGAALTFSPEEPVKKYYRVHIVEIQP